MLCGEASNDECTTSASGSSRRNKSSSSGSSSSSNSVNASAGVPAPSTVTVDVGGLQFKIEDIVAKSGDELAIWLLENNIHLSVAAFRDVLSLRLSNCFKDMQNEFPMPSSAGNSAGAAAPQTRGACLSFSKFVLFPRMAGHLLKPS